MTFRLGTMAMAMMFVACRRDAERSTIAPDPADAHVVAPTPSRHTDTGPPPIVIDQHAAFDRLNEDAGITESTSFGVSTRRIGAPPANCWPTDEACVWTFNVAYVSFEAKPPPLDQRCWVHAVTGAARCVSRATLDGGADAPP